MITTLTLRSRRVAGCAQTLAGLGTVVSKLGHEVEADTEKLIALSMWGYTNPETGMIRVQCEDSISEGRYVCVRMCEHPRRAVGCVSQ